MLTLATREFFRRMSKPYFIAGAKGKLDMK
jgi:hypothetical protein